MILLIIVRAGAFEVPVPRTKHVAPQPGQVGRAEVSRQCVYAVVKRKLAHTAYTYGHPGADSSNAQQRIRSRKQAHDFTLRQPCMAQRRSGKRAVDRSRRPPLSADPLPGLAREVDAPSLDQSRRYLLSSKRISSFLFFLFVKRNLFKRV
jgi:hypothetical protein